MHVRAHRGLEQRLERGGAEACDRVIRSMTQSYTPPWKDANGTATEVRGIREYDKDLRAELARVVRAPAVQRGLY